MRHRSRALLRAGQPAAAKTLLETWFATTTEAVDRDLYERIAELYVVHTLGALRDPASAEAFLQFNTILSPATIDVRLSVHPRCYQLDHTHN